MTLTSAQVTTVYMAVLRRDATTAEQTSGQVSADAAALSTTLVASTEATNSVDPVVRVYQAAFGRLPDSPGLTYWVDQVRSGARTLENVSASFLGEPEAVTRNIGSATSNADFVTNLYQNVLGRVGDAEGIGFWNNALASGMSRGLVLNGFANSLEFRTSTSANVDNLLTGLGNAALDLDTLSTSGSGLSNVTSSTTVTTPTTPTTPINVTYLLSGVGNITEGANSTVTLMASSSLAAATIFHYHVIPRTVSGVDAASSADFIVASGTIRIAAGASSVTFDLSAVNDNVMEGFEAFAVTIFDSTFTNSLASANGVITNNASSGQALTLTANIDNIVATTGDDMITAPAATANTSTLNFGDSIDGGAGTDTLLVSINNGLTMGLSNVSNVETIYGMATGAGALSLSGTSGVTTVGLRESTAAGVFEGIGSASTALVVESSLNGGTFTHTQAALAGGADAVNLTLGALSGGTVTIGSGAGAGVETLNVSTRLAPVVLSDLVSSDVATLNISGDQSITIGNTVSGSVLNSATTINGSTATGALILTIGATSATSVSGGSANDTLTMVASTGSDSINAGAGNDIITFAAGLTNTDSVDGGAGVDTLRVGTQAQLAGYIAPSTATLSNLEVLDYTGVVTGATLNAAAFGVSTFNASNTAARTGALVVTGGAGAFTLGLSGASGGSAADVTINDTGTATNDTLTINNNTVATHAFGAGILSVNGYETVTFNGSAAGTGGPTRQVFDTIILRADTGGSTRLNLVGFNTIQVVNGITAGVIDASGLTGPTASFVMNRGVFGVTSVIGSAGNDSLLVATSSNVSGGDGNDFILGSTGNDTIAGDAGDDNITAGRGNDIITGGDGDDTITLGTGTDSVDGGAGNDIINAEGNLSAGDTINGGDGIDTLFVTVAPSVTTALFITGFEILESAVNVSLLELAGTSSTLTTLRVAGNAADVSFTNAGNNINTLSLSGTSLLASRTYVFGRMIDTTSDALTVSFDQVGSAAVLGTLTLNNEESVTITRADVAGVPGSGATTLTNLNITDATSLTFDVDTTTGGAFIVTNALNAPNLATVDTTRSTADITLSAANSAVAMTVTAGSGHNKITTGSGADMITLGSGGGVIDAGIGSDTIIGGSGLATLIGGIGNDTIIGGAGNETISAGTGNDTIDLTAGGIDTVLATGLMGTGVDTIIGFTPGIDGDTWAVSVDRVELFSVPASDTVFNGRLIDAQPSRIRPLDLAWITEVAVANNQYGADGLFDLSNRFYDNVFVLSGATFADAAAAEAAIEPGGSRVFRLSDSTQTKDILMIMWSDGVDSYLGGYVINHDLYNSFPVLHPLAGTLLSVGFLTAITKFEGIDVSIAGTFHQNNIEFLH